MRTNSSSERFSTVDVIRLSPAVVHVSARHLVDQIGPIPGLVRSSSKEFDRIFTFEHGLEILFVKIGDQFSFITREQVAMDVFVAPGCLVEDPIRVLATPLPD